MKKLFIYMFLFTLIFLYSYFLGPNISDEIWNYGFSYNISHGLVIYRDFNVLQTPLLFFIGSIFISLFGHHLWSVHILNSLIIMSIFIMLYKSINKKSFIIFPFILLYCLYSYSLLCLLFIFIILYLNNSNSKYKDILIAFFVSLIFLTKQNIGICMIIPMLWCSKNRIKSLLVFFIPLLILSIYLIYNDALYSFVDCCFLGMLEFGNNNSYYSYLTIIWIISFIYFCFNIIKTKFKDINSFYILAFHAICIPIFDWYHFIFVFILFLYYILYKYDFAEFRYKYFLIISIICYVLFFGVSDAILNFNICCNKNSFMYGRNVSNIYFERVGDVYSFINNNINEYGDNIFIFSNNAYLIKLELGIDINNFDLILDGNMGYNGDVKRIRELDNICYNSKCLFVIDKDIMGLQLSKKIKNYVIESYDKIDVLEYYEVYSN